MGLLNRIRAAGPPPVQTDAQPLSVTGRGHVDGFLQLEELNVNLQGVQGLETYDRMFRTDGDVSQVVRLAANPIIAGTWEVNAAGGPDADEEAQEDAAFVRWALFENMSPNLRGHLMECLPVLFRSGFSPFEKVWEVTDYQGEMVTVPRSLQLRLPRTIYRWKQDQYGGLEAIEQYLPVPRAQVIAGPNVIIPGNPVLTGPDDNSTGEDDTMVTDTSIITDTRTNDYRQTVWMPMINLLYYRIGAEGDNWEGVSLLRPAYKHWLFKDSIERMDAIAQEKEALGLPVCYPPLGATPAQLDAMETVLSNIRTNSQGYVVMPGPKASGTSTGTGFGNGWLLEYLRPNEHGTGRDPGPSLEYHTNKIAAAFIAEFLRTGTALTGGGAGRAAPFEQDPFMLAVEAFAGLIEDILNEQLVAPLIAYNRPNAKGIPQLKMSLVDTTTISELADFILKLVQVGALLPDRVLEDFLRARADLPPADPAVVKERGNLDDSLRREVMMGKNGSSGDPAGTNGPAGSSTGGSATGTKGTDNKTKAGGGGATSSTVPSKPAPPASAHDAMTAAALKKHTSLSASPVDMSPYSADTQQERWRPQAFYEMSVDLDGIEDHFDGAPQGMLDNVGGPVHRAARKQAEQYPKRVTSDDIIRSSIGSKLQQSYDYGAQTISGEIEKHMGADNYQLSEFTGRKTAENDERAAHGEQHILDAIYHAVAHAHMNAGSLSTKQRAGEKAGAAAAKEVARAHTGHAFNQGRQDRLLDTSGLGVEWGVRYTAILDNNTCGECRDADDGTLRPLDDPWLQEHMPPNPECESSASLKGNQCRCFLIPERMPQGS